MGPPYRHKIIEVGCHPIGFYTLISLKKAYKRLKVFICFCRDHYWHHIWVSSFLSPLNSEAGSLFSLGEKYLTGV